MSGGDARERVLEAAYALVSRYGLAKTTVEDVAQAAGLSRATLYRMFPGGRDELFATMVGREMDRFFLRLADAVGDAPDFATVLETALVHAHSEIAHHAVLQMMLATEPERLLPMMTVEEIRIHDAVVAYLRPLLEREVAAGRVRAGIDHDHAGERRPRRPRRGAPGRPRGAPRRDPGGGRRRAGRRLAAVRHPGTG